MSDLSDTICALSTSPGRSGLAVVRVSGANSEEIFQKIFRIKSTDNKIRPRMSLLGCIVDPSNDSEIDEAMAVLYRAPKSYTGEDMAEYSIHGSPVLIASLLDTICKTGARLAEPGEFTRRAFLNGKMDLTQAEATGDIINATTLFQTRVAARQRSGEISKKLQPIKSTLIEIIVQLETTVEFVEENLPLDSRTNHFHKLQSLEKGLRRGIESFRRGRIVREGFDMAVVGRPNVGKSSIFNALLMQDRAIVMDMPGTTRDLISEITSIGGIPVRLLDTAGIHNEPDYLEKLGIERTQQAISDADAVLFVVDRSVPISNDEKEIKSLMQRLPGIVVMNKCDLNAAWTGEEISEFAENRPYIEISAKNGQNIEKLRALILENIFGSEGIQQDNILITNLRHCHYLESAESEIQKAINALNENMSEEFPLFHLHKSLQSLGAITGETSVEDLLSEIFSSFCIGK